MNSKLVVACAVRLVRNSWHAGQNAVHKLLRKHCDCLQASDEAKDGFGGDTNEIFWQESSKAANKSVLKVDVNCTPISALDELLKQLDGPCIPTFKLKDLASPLVHFINHQFIHLPKNYHAGALINRT